VSVPSLTQEPAGFGALAPTPPLPCQNSNTYATTPTSPPKTTEEKPAIELTPYARKQSYSLKSNVESLLQSSDIHHVAFITITFHHNLRDHKLANRRFNHLTRRDFPRLGIRQWVKVSERQKRGSWHFHVLAQVLEDVRTGYDFIEAKTYQNQGRLFAFVSANPHLEKLKQDLLPRMRRHKIGIFTVEPVRTSCEAVAVYLSKYIGKHLCNRRREDKGVRLINYSRDYPKACTVRFAWNSPGAKAWRAKVALLFSDCATIGEVSQKYGPKWPYKFKTLILKQVLPPENS